MTPLIDVMLVLLVIFMITAPLMASSLKLDLPKTDAGQPTDTPQFISIALDRRAALFRRRRRRRRDLQGARHRRRAQEPADRGAAARRPERRLRTGRRADRADPEGRSHASASSPSRRSPRRPAEKARAARQRREAPASPPAEAGRIGDVGLEIAAIGRAATAASTLRSRSSCSTGCGDRLVAFVTSSAAVAGEAVLRVELATCSTPVDRAPRARHRRIEKVVVVIEVGQHERVDQQRRLERRDRRLDQRAAASQKSSSASG